MTFALLRAGLPNSIVAVALAAVPIVALAVSPPQRAPHLTVPSQMIAACCSEPADSPIVAD